MYRVVGGKSSHLNARESDQRVGMPYHPPEFHSFASAPLRQSSFWISLTVSVGSIGRRCTILPPLDSFLVHHLLRMNENIVILLTERKSGKLPTHWSTTQHSSFDLFALLSATQIYIFFWIFRIECFSSDMNVSALTQVMKGENSVCGNGNEMWKCCEIAWTSCT